MLTPSKALLECKRDKCLPFQRAFTKLGYKMDILLLHFLVSCYEPYYQCQLAIPTCMPPSAGANFLEQSQGTSRAQMPAATDLGINPPAQSAHQNGEHGHSESDIASNEDSFSRSSRPFSVQPLYDTSLRAVSDGSSSEDEGHFPRQRHREAFKRRQIHRRNQSLLRRRM